MYNNFISCFNVPCTLRKLETFTCNGIHLLGNCQLYREICLSRCNIDTLNEKINFSVHKIDKVVVSTLYEYMEQAHNIAAHKYFKYLSNTITAKLIITKDFQPD